MLPAGFVFGTYRIVASLGEGGMGAVYRAQDESGREVALKLVRPELSQNEALIRRFRREARAARAVAHENVVTILDEGEIGGVPYLTFELAPGGSLQGVLRERGALPWREAAAHGAGIARGLGAIHAVGLVHRDLKPGNVLLDGDGRPKIADLGLVRAGASGLSFGGLTRTGELLGTLEYLAPEQGEAAKDVGPAADLYALGCTLYALLTGAPPFEGQGIELLKSHMLDAPTPVRSRVKDVPARLDELVLRLLEKEPARRGPDANAVALELEAIARGELGRRGRGRIGLALAALTIALAAAGWLVVGRARPAPPPPPAPSPPVEAPPKPVPPSPPIAPAPAVSLPPGLRLGDRAGEYVWEKDGSVLVHAPEAKFPMGWNESLGREREESHPREKPQHAVELSEFYIGKVEVTNAQFERFVRATSHLTAAEGSRGSLRRTGEDILAKGLANGVVGRVDGASWRKPLGPDGADAEPDHPVVHVSWGDAIAYCEWAGLVLPTEAQWERTASWAGAPPKRIYPWGNERPATGVRVANIRDQRFRAARLPGELFGGPCPFGSDYDDLWVTTAPVGSYPAGASALGALDLSGNVWEWCADLYDGEYYSRSEPRDPEGPRPSRTDLNPKRVIRGGGFRSYNHDAKTVVRTNEVETISYDEVGFRVVLEPNRQRKRR